MLKGVSFNFTDDNMMAENAFVCKKSYIWWQQVFWRSFIKIGNNSAPSALPCGTVLVMFRKITVQEVHTALLLSSKFSTMLMLSILCHNDDPYQSYLRNLRDLCVFICRLSFRAHALWVKFGFTRPFLL